MSVVEANSYSAKGNYADFLSDEDEFDEDEGPIREGIEAVVFWDAQDYPIRSGDHELVFQKIKETLSVCPKVSIHAYVTNKLSDGLRSKYEQAQIIVHHLSRGEKANWQILLDIQMWTMRCEYRSNLF